MDQPNPSSSSEPGTRTFELPNLKIQHNRSNLDISPLPTTNHHYLQNSDDDDSDDEGSLQRGRAAEHESLLSGEKERESLGITNLDLFFQQVYMYFSEKGFWCMVVERILRLL